jgi:hypothetical protein
MAKENEYIIKKFVRARSAAEALALDAQTPVREVYLVADSPDDKVTFASGIGFMLPTGE